MAAADQIAVIKITDQVKGSGTAPDLAAQADRARELVRILLFAAQPDQWQPMGGPGSIRSFFRANPQEWFVVVSHPTLKAGSPTLLELVNEILNGLKV